jgi:hypothetical protein
MKGNNPPLTLNIQYLPPLKEIDTTADANSIAIIVPHRNRIEQLKTFLTLFKSQSSHIDIYVIDQNNADRFNRGLLLNIGFHIANTSGKYYDRYIFHDVDSYPDTDLKRQYKIDPKKYKIIHYASPLLGYKYSFPHFFGGVVAFDAPSFKQINGFPNNIFGWGAEDDILRQRVGPKRIIYRPIVGHYELPEHDKPTSTELSFQNNADKWAKINADHQTWAKNGVNQIANLFITVVQSTNWRQFISEYDVSNMYLPYTLLASFKHQVTGGNGNSANGASIYYFKIDYLAQHIVSPNKTISFIMNKNYAEQERIKRLAEFKGASPIFYKNDQKSPYYNYIEPLLYWDEIQEHIIDSYTAPKRLITHTNSLKGDLFANYVEHNGGNRHLTKTDLKNTLRFIFQNYNEAIFFRIRSGKLTHKYYLFNVGSPIIDWYSDLKWGRTTNSATTIQKLQQFVAESQIPYYMTLAKPHYLRANGCLLGIQSTDYVKELNKSYVKGFLEMLEYSCEKLEMPDCDIIINRKDFAYFNRNNTYAYEHLLHNVPIQNAPKKWFPVFSQSVIPHRNLDIPIPSADEWTIINSPLTNGETPWSKKRAIGFFRGSSTGCGTTIDNNVRMKFAHISKRWEKLKTKNEMIDIGISQLTSRIKAFDQKAAIVDKIANKYLMGKFTDAQEQSRYKYIFNIPGNGQAYRFPTEFFKGGVVINVEDRETPQMWFQPLLRDGYHYVRLRGDYKNIEKQEDAIYDTIKWLQQNDEIAEKIANNGRNFAIEFINRDKIAQYWYILALGLNKMQS